MLVGNFLADLPRLSDEAMLALVLRGESDATLARKPTATNKAAAISRLFPGPAFAHASAGLADLDAPTVRDYYARLVASDAFRILKGRIAASYDGGQILEDE